MKPERKTTGFEIAVIGMDGRFPAAPNIKRFWENLISGTESIVFLSDEELKEAGVRPSLINNPDFVKIRGGVLESKEFFDANFFDYSPREAEIMDPQIRLFHECSWNALEDAGYTPATFGGAIGIYAGASANLNWQVLVLSSGKGDELGLFDAYQLFDNDTLSRRVAYKLDLKGPAVVVQSACSTSLLAIHMACRALLTGECDMALAGGVTVSTEKNPGYIYQEGMVLSPDGHCRAFDADARGFVGGEGVGVVVLKRLKHAAAHRDHIHAIILASAANNDGNMKVGYTAPGIEGQVGVIRTALRLARVEPESIGCIETHGTATILGDPIEIKALIQAFNTDKKSYCGIGSVKTNFGHLDAAAGAAGFIKTVLMLKHRRIPPSLHFERPNPEINFVDSPFYVNAGLSEWECDSYPLRAAVSSFGLGGTNVHVILEQAPVIGHSSLVIGEKRKERQHQLIILSAKTGPALQQRIRDLLDYLNENPAAPLADAAYTLQVGRKHFKYKAAVVCSTSEEAITALSSLLEDFPKEDFPAAQVNRPKNQLSPGRPGNPPDLVDQDLQPLLKQLQDCINTPDTESPPVPNHDMYLTWEKIGQAWCSGLSIDWNEIYKNNKRYRAALPAYPFEGKRYWIEGDPYEMTAAGTRSQELHKLADMAQWFYLPLWEQAMPIVPLTPGFNKKLNWLIFMDDVGIGTRLLMELEQQGQRVITAKKSTHFSSSNDAAYQVNPAAGEDYETLFKTLIRLDRVPHKILHLWNVGEVGRDSSTGPGFDELTRSRELGISSLLGIVRAIGTLRLTHKIEIEVISSNMQQVAGEERLCPEKATLIGAVKIIPLEYFNIKCRSIDILFPPSTGKQEKDLIRQLLAEVSGDISPSQPVTALRGNRKWVQTFKPLRLTSSPARTSPIKQQGVYLITGGFGGMGFTFAEHLARTVKARLILVGRSPFPPRQKWQEWLAGHGENNDTSRKIRKVLELEAQGAQLMITRADVSHLEQMRPVIARAGECFGPINGVLHTAGLADFDGVIQKRSGEATRRIMAPKVDGTLVLDHLLKDMPLDFFVLFSSVGNVVYGHKFGQVGYNAANEFLDAFALYKTQKDGTLTVAINWDDWSEVGMYEESRRWKYSNSPGYSGEYHANSHVMAPSEGVEVFKRILSTALPRVVVSTMDLTAMLKLQDQQLENVEQTLVEAFEGLKSPDRSHLPPVSTEYMAPGNVIQRKLAVTWKNFFGFERIGINDNFFELGGDSLKAITLLTKVHQAYDVKVPLAVFFDRPTIAGLAGFLDGSEQEILSPLQEAEEKEYYRLSSAQKRLYILQQFEMDNTVYNMPMVISMEKEIDKEKLETAFKKLIARHESLRTTFEMIDEEPVQKIHDDVEFKIEYYDLATEAIGANSKFQITNKRGRAHMAEYPDPKSHELRAKSWMDSFIRPFDLTQAPLLRVGLIKIEKTSHILLVDIHHIITDGTSQIILTQEFMSIYAGEELTPLRLQYKDYSEWQNSTNQKETIKQQEKFWLKEFEVEIPLMNLPIDYKRPVIQDFEGNWMGFSIAGHEIQALKTLALEQNATLYMILIAIFNVFLSKLSDQTDVVIGTPTAGRLHTDLEKVIGMFVNTLAIRNYPAGGKTFKEFLIEVKERTLKVFENQEYPFEDLIEKVEVKRDTGRNPMFDVMFALQNMDVTEVETPGLKLNRYDYENRKSKFDLTLLGFEADELFFHLEYCTKLFREETIDRFIGFFKKIISLVIEDPEKKISEIDIISEEEKRQILFDFNDTKASYPKNNTIHELFEEQVERTPGNIAVLGPSCGVFLNEVQLTYKELNHKSNQLAYILKEKGVLSNSIVCIMVERSIEMIISILGIIKAGGGYLPIDPGYSEERINYILADSGAKILLSAGHHPDLPSSSLPSFSHLPIFPSSQLPSFSHLHLPPVPATSLAYIIYTSGSTGKPKGTMLEHRNLVNLLRWGFKYTNLDFSSVLQFATISFDASFHEIFSTVLSGGELCLIKNELRTDIPRLFEFIEKNIIRTVFLPISFLKIIFNESHYTKIFPRCIRHIQTAGEQVVISERFASYLKAHGIYLYNHYGPTEAHVVTAYTVDPTGEIPQLPPIGKPISNTMIYILDKYLNVQPVGVIGELYIGGIQVGRGYLNNPELTAEKFLRMIDAHDKFRWEGAVKSSKGWEDGNSNRRLYKSGDLARYLLDGNVEFSGRIDNQVKIRGFRIEPGEIEGILLKNNKIKEAAVLAREDKRGDKYLCAYIVARSKEHGSVSEEGSQYVPALREYLSQTLPDYMVPSYFVPVEKIPVTLNGKVDRKALPAPEIQVQEGYVAPGNELEMKLAEIWSEVLGIKKDIISVYENFFNLGGHSLKSTILVSKIHKAFDVKVPLAEVFKTPNIKGLASFIIEASKDKYAPIVPSEAKYYYRLSSTQKRLYILQQLEADSTSYNLPQVISMGKEIDKEKLETSFKKLITRHESLRTSFDMIDEEPVQKIHDEVEFKIEYYDLAAGGKDGKMGRCEDEKMRTAVSFGQVSDAPGGGEDIISSFVRPFDLSQAPLLRVGLIHLHAPPFGHPSQEGREQKYILMFDMHHIITDGTSHDILTREFMTIYAGEELTPLRLQYKDYSEWQNSTNQKEAIKQQEEFWLKEFEGEIPVLNLPTDYKRPTVQSFEGDTVSFEIDRQQTRQLKKFALEENVTTYILMLAICYVLLAKLSGQEDIIVGTDVEGRTHADLDGIIGMFVNTLALRNSPGREKTFKEFLEEVRKRTIEAFENQEYPFENLVDRLGVIRDPSHNPLFDVMFTLQTISLSSTAGETSQRGMPGLSGNPYDFINNTAKFDLLVEVFDLGDRFLFNLEYCTKLFSEETINNFKKHLREIVSAIINDINIKIKDIRISHDLLTAQKTLAPVEFGF